MSHSSLGIRIWLVLARVTVLPGTHTLIHLSDEPYLPFTCSYRALRLAVISSPTEGRRLSCPGWLGEILRWFARHPSQYLSRQSGIETATIELQVQRRNHWTTKPQDIMY